MGMNKQRVLFVAMLPLGLVSPLFAIIPLLLFPEATLGDSPEALGIAIVVLALLVPFVFLYFAARAAVRGAIPGVVVLGSWWLMGVIAALLAQRPGHPADSVIKAVSLGVITPSGDGAWSLPGFVQALGSSSSFALELPLYALFLMGAYTGIKQYQLKIARVAEHPRLYSAWDENGERVDAPAPRVSGE